MPKRQVCAWMALVAAGGAALMAGEQVWKVKRIAEWSVEEARQVLTESPWAKTVTPAPGGSGAGGQQRSGISAGGMGIGGMGMGRRGGRGGAGRGSNDSGSADSGPMPVLTLRWASAMPAIAAALIAHAVNAPSVDEGYSLVSG